MRKFFDWFRHMYIFSSQSVSHFNVMLTDKLGLTWEPQSTQWNWQVELTCQATSLYIQVYKTAARIYSFRFLLWSRVVAYINLTFQLPQTEHFHS